ncbi:unnamed protein product [Prorocentrum cordatum]|uniref:ATP-dependent DNA helicase n=1 Tax=Prorocentrum cordatum TaxID=2364126 RepID=A0ABN9SI66_9DINO|nr:unnamed protein product [Polarella glacialis]
MALPAGGAPPLLEQLQWLRSCRCWTDAFGARVDAEALGQRVGPPNGAEVLTLACDWEPLWKRARSSRLCGGEHGHPAALPQPGHPAAVPQPSQPAARQAAGHPAAWQQASGSPPAAWQHAAGHPPAPHPGHPAPQSTGAPPPLAPVAPAGALEQLAYGGASEALVQELRAWRSGRASASRKRFPELTNKTLESIASAVPTTDAELLAVPGIARKKADELGPEILEICRRHALGGGQRPPATPQVVPASPWMERPAKRARQGAPPPRGGVAACAAAGAPAAGAPAAAPSARVEAGMLTGEQRAAAERALRGENLFITGAAGTGKSFLLRYVVQELEAKMGGPGRLAVTAPTGLAAINVGGVTVHSFAGIGIMQQDGVGNMHRYMAARIGNSKVSSQRWRDTDVLVIDEISMLAPAFFDQLEAVARQVRRRRDPPAPSAACSWCSAGTSCSSRRWRRTRPRPAAGPSASRRQPGAAATSPRAR